MEQNLKHSKRKKLNIDDHFYVIHEYGIDYENNEIYLMGSEEYASGNGEAVNEPGVEYTMANKFIKNLQTLMKKGSEEEIVIHMKTCGGDWNEGMAIYEAIKFCPNPVTILNYNHARSMSSIIFLAANKRVMMPSSKFMFHRGTMHGGGTCTQYLTEAAEVEKDLDTMLNIYINAMKKNGKMKSWSKKRIKEWLDDQMNKKEEVYLNAQQAVKMGFAHEVFNGNWDELREYSDDQLIID